MGWQSFEPVEPVVKFVGTTVSFKGHASPRNQSVQSLN